MKAAAYARFSTERQNENSIDTQLAAIADYCQRNNITIVSTYVDMALSGTNTDRPDFQRMLDAAKMKLFDAVVVYDISRASRDVGDWMSFRKLMQMLGVQVISTTENLGRFDDPNAFLTELLTAGLGQHMVLQTRQKSIAGVAEKAKKGAFLGGLPPLGYDIVDGYYVVNEAEAAVIRKIFAMYATGASYNAILDAISGARGKRGQPLGKNSLHSILRNERYVGVYSWNRKHMKYFGKWAGGTLNPNCVRIENSTPVLIDESTWEKVQSRMDDRKRNAANKATRPYLLSGLIECEGCGAAYVGHTSTSSKGYQTRYYCCGNRYRTRTCNAKNLNADEVETFVVQHLTAFFLETDFEEAARYIADQVNNSSADLTKERAELRRVDAKINNGVAAILEGTKIPELDAELDRLRKRKSELEDIIGRRTMSRTEVKSEDIVKLFQNAIENWNSDTLPQIIKQHVTKIYAHIDGTFTVNVGVHINGCGGRI